MMALLLSAVVGALPPAPDGGRWPVARSHQHRWLATEPGQPVRARVDVETFVVRRPDLERDVVHAFEVLTLSLPDGGTTPGLDAVNQALHAGYRWNEQDAPPSPASLADGTAPFYSALAAHYGHDENANGVQGTSTALLLLHGPFVQARVCSDDLGAYPSTNCTLTQRRTDTGDPWSWMDAIAPGRQVGFLEACSRLLGEQARAQKQEHSREHADLARLYPGMYPERCTAQFLERAEATAKGDLEVDLGWLLPHVVKAFGWRFTLPRAALVKWADPRGPLGPRSAGAPSASP